MQNLLYVLFSGKAGDGEDLYVLGGFCRLHSSTDFEAVHPWKHDVQNDEIRLEGGHLWPGVEPILGLRKLRLAFETQGSFDESDHRRFVIHDEDALLGCASSEVAMVPEHAILHEEVLEIGAQDPVMASWGSEAGELASVDPLEDGGAGHFAILRHIARSQELRPSHLPYLLRHLGLLHLPRRASQ